MSFSMAVPREMKGAADFPRLAAREVSRSRKRGGTGTARCLLSAMSYEVDLARQGMKIAEQIFILIRSRE